MPEVKYSLVLRCIGQDLERRGITRFEIRRDGSHFIASGSGPRPATRLNDVIRYTPADLEMMERCGEIQRGNSLKRNFLHLAQLLRTLGEHFDKYGSSLVMVSYDAAGDGSPLHIEYVSREGERLIEERAGAALFDDCVLMFQKRIPQAGSPASEASDGASAEKCNRK
jgi:hypothetical protein